MSTAKQKQELKTKYDELLKVVENHKRVADGIYQLFEANRELTHVMHDLVEALMEREVFRQTGSYPETKKKELKIVNRD